MWIMFDFCLKDNDKEDEEYEVLEAKLNFAFLTEVVNGREWGSNVRLSQTYVCAAVVLKPQVHSVS
jgi:hypothetical protein